MADREFELIERFFQQSTISRSDVLLGIGDDAALLRVPEGRALVVAVDTLIDGVHFPHNTPAADIAYKALAVNLSDLAAMGATPAWATLALTLPDYNEAWLTEFSRGFFELGELFDVALIGGDTTRGHLSLSVQLQGFVEAASALKRSGAQPGDLIYVSGTLGDAGLGLLCHQGKVHASAQDRAYLVERLNKPQPRVELGQKLIGIASAAIDVSDGLVADLSHVLKASNVGAVLSFDEIPYSPAFQKVYQGGSQYVATDFALSSGDDYELCFTVPRKHQRQIKKLAKALNLPLTQIGEISEELGLRVMDKNGTQRNLTQQGYQHF